jgi:hypothetical protein
VAGIHAWRSHAAMRFLTPVIHPRDQEQALHNVNVCVQAGGRGFFPINHQMPCFRLAEIAAAARSRFPKARIGINGPRRAPFDRHSRASVGGTPLAQGMFPFAHSP